MSSFGAKRKARKIAVQEDEEDKPIATESLNPPPEEQEPALQATFKSRKPGSTKSKKRQSGSRLSFGPSVQDGDSVGAEEIVTPKKASLAAAAADNSAQAKGILKNRPLGRLPMRSLDDDDERPRYSKEYLSQLQSSTPNTPQNMSKMRPDPDDEMSLDPSELEGAMIVDTGTSSSIPTTTTNTTTVLTNAQILEKKARRARFATQTHGSGSADSADFISLSDDDDTRRPHESYLQVLSRSSTKPKSKSDTRLIPEDEDLGEGHDFFVEDGGLSLGRKAEREARRKRRQEMESLIQSAQGGGGGGPSSPGPHATHNVPEDDDDDDSEAERRAAYDAAQTRAGMDGLAEERAAQARRLGLVGVVQVPPRIAPLPDLSVLVDKFKERMRLKEQAVAGMRARILELKDEKEAVLKREPEVQGLLNDAGERYRALMMPGTNGAAEGEERPRDAGSNVAAAKSLLDAVRGDPATPGGRGLESLGATPVRQSQMEL
ncbi:nineteen complex-related protein 2-domain-containing protein [Xylariaceae sp. FL0016]|nr:nineteen complex-related protein 2-domain-containing protein [Xylariaceae sp. FL0016]